MKKRVTLKEIAEQAGYSANTVSRALRGDERLPLSTREKIIQTADEMGYIRNHSASSLRLGRSNTVAVIIDDLANVNYMLKLSEIDQRLRDAGYVVMILCSHGSIDLERALLRQSLSREVDGIILFPISTTSSDVSFVIGKVPIVLAYRGIEGVHTDLVCVDDEQGGYEAGKMLYQHGHRRFLYIAGNEENVSHRMRCKGFKRALAEEGVAPDALRILRDEQIRYASQEELLAALQPVEYTAIFAFYDHYAYQAKDALEHAGYRIPEDVEVVGFDRFRQVYHYLPPMESVAARVGYSLSKEVVELLLARINGAEGEPVTRTLPVQVYAADA